MLGTLFTFPTASTFLAGVGAWSSPLFEDFLPLIYLIFGILAVVVIIVSIINAMHPSKK